MALGLNLISKLNASFFCIKEKAIKKLIVIAYNRTDYEIILYFSTLKLKHTYQMQYSSNCQGNLLHKSGKGLYECWMI